MKNFGTLIQGQKGFLETMPGDHYFGDITGHGIEWRTEFTLDYCPSDESEEQENQYDLVFALIKNDEDETTPVLSLDYWVAEVGVNDTHKFTLTDPDDVMAQLVKVCDEWDMRKNSAAIGKALIDKVFELKNAEPAFFAGLEG